jgi:hypothetical protein
MSVLFMPENRESVMRERLRHLLMQGWKALDQNPVAATPVAREAESLARNLGDNATWAQSLLIWGIAALYEGQAYQAIELLAQSLAVHRFLGDEEGQWYCLSAISSAWNHLGDTVQAAETRAVAAGFVGKHTFENAASWLRWFKTA